jgi:hypothetical protein
VVSVAGEGEEEGVVVVVEEAPRPAEQELAG